MESSCLITGASGFIGRRLHLGLAGAGYRVIALDRTCDLSVPLPALRLPEHCDTVYHCAGLAHFSPRGPADAGRFFGVNARGTRHLLDALPPSVRRFVLISTVAVYGREQGSLIPEDAPREARDPYGASKKEAEDLALAWAARRGATAAILRLPLVVGRNAPGNLGAMIDAMRRARYFGIAPGDARRSMVWAADVAAIAPVAASVGGVYNLTDGRHPTFQEIERGLAAALGVPAPRQLPRSVACAAAICGDLVNRFRRLSPIDSRIFRRMTCSLTFDDARARAALGWNPRPVLDCLGEFSQWLSASHSSHS